MAKAGVAVRHKLAAVIRDYLGPVTHFRMHDRVAALTFDDGPHPEYTLGVLEILARFGIHATFFMIGQAAVKHPFVVRKVADAGHVIGNHSWDHSRFPILTSRERRDQLRACQMAIAPYGHRLFRAPWGKQTLKGSVEAFLLGYKTIEWNVEVGDWWEGNSEGMACLLAGRLRPGAVILLHDGVFVEPGKDGSVRLERDAMLKALTLFLERSGQRFRFATVPEMFRLGRPMRRRLS